MQKSLKSKIIKAASITFAVILVCVGAFFIYAADYYRADDVAQGVAEQEYVTQTEEGDFVLTPQENMGVGLIFYPGAKVDTKAYLPLLDRLCQSGITCYLIEMPFHFAFFRTNAAAEIMARNTQISRWYIAGHSLGGAMASQFAAEHQDEIDGLILLAAYLYKEYPVAQTLTIYGSLDTSVEEKLNYSQNVYVLEGGNHAQFGNYGKQSGDADATISREEQQQTTALYITSFIRQQPLLP